MGAARLYNDDLGRSVIINTLVPYKHLCFAVNPVT